MLTSVRIAVLRVSVAVYIAFLTCCVANCQREILTNPDFERLNDKDVPIGWRIYGGGIPESKLLVVKDAHSGERAIRLIDRGPRLRDIKCSIGIYQELPVKAGRWYRASVYAKALARNHERAVALQLTFMPMQKHFAVYIAPPIDGKFHRIQVAGRAPDGAKSVRLYIYTIHYWQSDTIVDCASLTEIPDEIARRLAPLLCWSSTGIMQVRKLNRETPIAVDGKPCAVIVHPAGKSFLRLAKRIQNAVHDATGARLPLIASPKLDRSNPAHDIDRLWRWRARMNHPNIIAIGNMLNNVVIERLYWNRYAFADSLFPGDGNYVIRTVCEPYNFHRKQNVIVLAASDVTGLQKCIREFSTLITKWREGGALTVPYTLIVSPRRVMHKVHEQFLNEIRTGKREPPADFTRFIAFGREYLRTGELGYAELAKRVLLACWRRYFREPRYRLTWSEETKSMDIGFVWDAIEEAPIFNDVERLICTHALLVCLYSLPRHVMGDWGRLHLNETIIWNHQTFPLMGIYTIARYMLRFYGDVDGKMDFYLSQVRGAFRGQIKSWKPQCDADGYATIVPNHTIVYTLAEGDYTYFANGNVRKFAEYLAHVCDNRGWTSGFGDSSYYRSSVLLLHGLPIAFWYYRDGRYLWWLKRNVPNWRNPFWHDVKPKEWRELVGVTVIPLHKLVYEFTMHRPYYGEPLTPPNIPQQLSFDKIAFRENLSPDGQFMLLDGYASGKHLHYDGNAILKLSMLGDDFLIDGDYLVRNTTEHNMVSIVRDGRCEQLEPVCVALVACADGKRYAYTHTLVRDWNGADWHRHIFWQKGGWVAVIDELRALTEGNFMFECTWKTLNRKARGEGDWQFDGRSLKVSIYAEDIRGNQGLVTVPCDDASGGKAVKFIVPWAQLQFPVRLKRGRYAISLIAQGIGTGANSFWVRIDDGERVAFHIPVGRFGESSASWDVKAPTPRVRIDCDGLHIVTITLRESPGVLLDKIIVRDERGKLITEIEAESAPAVPGAPTEPPTRNYWLVNDGHAIAKTTQRISNVGLQILKVHQRIRAHMRDGAVSSFINLLFAERSDAPKGYRIARISETEALITDANGKPIAYIGTQQCEWMRKVKPIDAIAFIVTKRELITIHHPDAGERKLLQVGVRQFPSTWQCVMKVRKLRNGAELLSRIAMHVQKPKVVTSIVKFDAPRLKRMWTFDDGTSSLCKVIVPVDIDGDDHAELLIGKGKRIYCIGTDGKVRWQFECADAVNDIAVWRDKKGVRIFAGSEDEHVYVLNAMGGLIKRHHVTLKLRIGRSSVREPHVRTVLADDIDGDGKVDIFVGTANGCLARYDESFNLKWLCDTVEHGTTMGELRDLDGDGRKEIIVGNRYGSVEIFDANGGQTDNVYSELGDIVFAVGDINGDGKSEIVNGSSTGALTVKTYRGSMLWRFDNFGFAVTGAAIGDVDGDRHPEVIVASETGYLYVLNAAGRKEWHIDFGDALRALKLADLNRDGLFEIIIGGDNSCVAVVDSQGRIASWQLETAKVMKIEVSDSDSNKAVTPIILIATSNGQLVAYSGSVK